MQHLILLHGAIGAKDQLLPLQDCVGTKYEVHTIDFSGHGENRSDNSFSIEGFAQDVLEYMRQNNIQHTAVFGYSMGGYVAMYLASHYPNVISSIVTLATKFYWDEAIAAREIKMLDARIIREKVPAFANQLEQRHGTSNWEIVLEKTRGLLLQLGKHNILQDADYNHIPIPCLLLLGDKDKMVTEEETITVQRLLPQGEYRQLVNTPHALEQVDVKKLAGIIEEFAR